MKKYLLTIEDDELWKKVKSRAALIDMTIGEVIIGFLEGWIKNVEEEEGKERDA